MTMQAQIEAVPPLEIEPEIAIRVHHFLDIIKLHGAGLTNFTPDLSYGHDFAAVGNAILANPQTPLELVVASDDICTPCKWLNEGLCSDSVPDNPSQYRSKNDWNNTIDKRLMAAIRLKEGTRMPAIELASLALRTLNKDMIAAIWKERPEAETTQRAALLLEGLRQYAGVSQNSDTV